jgi:ABC-type sugar transport system substrate-binding protein
MAKKRIALFLASEKNDYQQELRSQAIAAATRASLAIEVAFAGADTGKIALEQPAQIYRAIGGVPETRPIAVLLFPLLDVGAVIEDIAKAGVGVVVLGRLPAYMDEIRSAHPGLPVFAVSPDQVEAGRIQGQQLRALLPGGGLVLSVQGSRLASATVDRAKGLVEALKDSAVRVTTTDGAWTSEVGEAAVARWIRQQWRKDTLSAIACQNDMMAVGARAALEKLASEAQYRCLKDIPVLGIDGSPALGQRMVDAGELAATVVMPPVSRNAIELLAQVLNGETAPTFVTIKPTSYPVGLSKS